MIPLHVLRAVDERLALNALAGWPASARYLVNMAKLGTCGQDVVGRKLHAAEAQRLAEWAEADGEAVAEPFFDLAYALETAEEGEEDRERCARALGAAWRAQSPFRRDREGDPLGVLVPNLSDKESVSALDRARRLPPPVPQGLHRRAAEISGLLSDAPIADNQPYSRSLARMLFDVADADMRYLTAVWKPGFAGSVDRRIRRTQDAMEAAVNWIDRDSARHSHVLHIRVASANADGGFVSAVSKAAPRLERAGVHALAAQAASSTDALLKYVAHYNEQARLLEGAEITAAQAGGAAIFGGVPERSVAKYRSLFPDFYPEHA